MQQKLSSIELEKWATTAWVIWNVRNMYYFEQVQVHPKFIFVSANGLLEEYQSLMAA